MSSTCGNDKRDKALVLITAYPFSSTLLTISHWALRSIHFLSGLALVVKTYLQKVQETNTVILAAT